MVNIDYFSLFTILIAILRIEHRFKRLENLINPIKINDIDVRVKRLETKVWTTDV